MVKIPVKKILNFYLVLKLQFKKIEYCFGIEFNECDCLQKCALELFRHRLAVQSSTLCDNTIYFDMHWSSGSKVFITH